MMQLSRTRLLPGSLLLLGLLLLPFSLGWLPIVRFTAEEIAIAVYPDHIQMNGTYHYENPFPFPVTQGFLIPLPQDSRHPEPVQIATTILSPVPSTLPVYFILGSHGFTASFAAKERLTIEVKYTQYTPDRDAWYILTTTQPWRRPLQKGLYTLSFHQTSFKTSNYPLIQEASGQYAFMREGFMPQEDWRFSWNISK